MPDWTEYSHSYKPRTDRIAHLPKPPKGYFWTDNGTNSYTLRTSSGPQGGVGFVMAMAGGWFDIYYEIPGANLPDELSMYGDGYSDMQCAAQRLIDVALEHKDITPTQSRQNGTRRGESFQ